MRKSGVVSKDVKGKDNEVYHDIISLFKIYRSVNWKMQIKINQVKQCFHTEYGTIGRASCRKECRSRWSPYH